MTQGKSSMTKVFSLLMGVSLSLLASLPLLLQQSFGVELFKGYVVRVPVDPLISSSQALGLLGVFAVMYVLLFSVMVHEFKKMDQAQRKSLGFRLLYCGLFMGLLILIAGAIVLTIYSSSLHVVLTNHPYLIGSSTGFIVAGVSVLCILVLGIAGMFYYSSLEMDAQTASRHHAEGIELTSVVVATKGREEAPVVQRGVASAQEPSASAHLH